LTLNSVLCVSVCDLTNALVLCNMLCTWALLDVVSSVERFPPVLQFLASRCPAYLVYKAAAIVLLLFWYGLETERPVGPFGRAEGRGVSRFWGLHRRVLTINPQLAHRTFNLVSRTYELDRARAKKRDEAYREMTSAKDPRKRMGLFCR
jgi:hypothetical protein